MAKLLVALLALPLLAATAPPSAAPAAPTADAAGNRIAAFPPFDLDQPPVVAVEGRQTALHCDAEEHWCAQVRRDGEGGDWRLEVHEGSPVNDAGFEPRRLALAGSDRLEFALWPHLVREAGGAVLVGVIATGRAWMSGGGARVSRLSLVRAAPGAAALREVMEVPFGSSAMIRACFSEQDMLLRAEACHDEYKFAGDLMLDPAATAGPPRFVLASRARTFPGRAFRLTDQQAADREQRQWARSELVWADDPQCSYRRTLAFDPAAGLYVPDAPLPDCGEYLDFGLELWPGRR